MERKIISLEIEMVATERTNKQTFLTYDGHFCIISSNTLVAVAISQESNDEGITVQCPRDYDRFDKD